MAKTPVTIRSCYQPSDNKGITFKNESKTQQHFKNECDVHTIVNRFIKAGIPLPQADTTMYADLTSLSDYHTMMNTIRAVEDNFNALPSDLRAYFHNDVELLIDFLDNPENESKAIELGLLPARLDEVPLADPQKAETPTAVQTVETSPST